MKPQSVTLADGSALKLLFTMDVWERLEDEMGAMQELSRRMAQPGRIRLLPQVAAMMALPREDGSAWTPEEIRARMTPPLFGRIQKAVNDAIEDSMRMEAEETKRKIVDEVAEELLKNADQAG